MFPKSLPELRVRLTRIVRVLIERAFSIRLLRLGIALVILARGTFYWAAGNTYKGMVDYCWLYRVSELTPFRILALAVIRRIVARIRASQSNIITQSFLRNNEARCSRDRYTLSGSGQLDLYRDVIALKDVQDGERGVILVKYTETFEAFVSFFDLDAVLRDYYVVLEPSWAGACDPAILMFVSSIGDVIIQTPEQEDYDFISGLHSRLRPILIGSADWVDVEMFEPDLSVDKKLDIVMVANWARHKNHKALFRALAEIKTRPLRVLLIGFECGGRTKRDILADLSEYDVGDTSVTILENLSAPEVTKYLRESKIMVMLSKKEGANKALAEALFVDVPGIVYERAIGGARARINTMTGILSSFEDLARNIECMVERYRDFQPRTWAIQNTGSAIATKKLNETLKDMAEKNGERWTADIAEKINRPNLAYKHNSSLQPLPVAVVLEKYLRKNVPTSLAQVSVPTATQGRTRVLSSKYSSGS